MSTGRKIELIEEDDGWWSAIDEETGVGSQGETQEEALAALDEAVALHEQESGVDDEDDLLREIGLDPAEIADERDTNKSLPEFLQ